MVRAYDDYGNVVDLVAWENQIRADAIDECIAIERDEELEKTFYQMEDGLISAKEYEMRELKKEQNNE